MGATASSKSSVRFALFSAGTLLLHAAAGWALPAPSTHIGPEPVAFSLIEQETLEAPIPSHGAGTGQTLARATNVAWPTKAGNPAKASPVRKRALPDSRDSRVGESLHSETQGELSPQSQRLSFHVEATAAEPSAQPDDDDQALAGVGSDRAHGGGAAGSSSKGEASSSGTGAGDVFRGPALLAAGDLCASYFPAHAHVDRGEVQIDVEVDASGRAHASAVMVEAPLGQGFAGAARECARWLRFAPALSQLGAPVAGHAKLKLRFKRRTA
jgi:hypothetical protein